MALNKTVRGSMGVADATVGPYRYRRQSASADTLRVTVYGTWVGTMSLQVSDPDQNVFITVEDGDFTANTSQGFTCFGDCDVRWKCTAYTSGTALGAIVGDA